MKFFKKSDLIFISVLIIIGVGGLAFYYLRPRGESLAAEIYYESRIIEKIPLSGEERTIPINGHENVKIKIGGGSVAFVESDCPDKVCVHTGELTRSGQSAACLPNRIIIKVVSSKGAELDGVAQ